MRAVLDSNSFRGSPEGEIEAIRKRGFALSLSLEALREVWARSLREDKKGMLERRIAVIAPHLDPEHPIAFTGRMLLTLIGRATPEMHAEDERWRQAIRAGWEDACRGLTDARWRAVGNELDDEIEQEADGWMREFGRMRHTLQNIVDVKKEVGFDWYPKGRGERVIEKMINGPALLNPPASQRLHLARRLLAIRSIASRERQLQRNDLVDLRLLFHIGWPAFVVTSDTKFIKAVDETGSLQRAWVRTPVEMIQDVVYRCEPWGKPGRWVGSRFRRQDLKALMASQDEMRLRLKG